MSKVNNSAAYFGSDANPISEQNEFLWGVNEM